MLFENRVSVLRSTSYIESGTVLLYTHLNTSGLGRDEKRVKLFGKLHIFNDLKLEDLNCDEAVLTFLKEFSGLESLPVNTSGSTGTPKSLLLQKKNMRASARATLKALNLKPGDKALLCLSAEYIAGKMMLVRWLEGELDLYLSSVTADPLKEIDGEFDFSAMVPYQVKSSYEELPRIKKLIIGGGPLDNELERELKKMPGEIYHTYGMTETISHIALRRINGKLKSEFFKALPGVGFSLDNRDCLVIDAPSIGVKQLITNDIVELNDKHSFIWRGRYDNVVNSGGIKLQPEEIEKKIKNLSQPFFVCGFPDKKWGEKLVLIIEGDKRSTVNFEELQPYQKPKEVFYLPYFVRTENGKIKRKETAKLLL